MLSLIFSAIIIVGAFVFPEVIVGMIEASTTLKEDIFLTLNPYFEIDKNKILRIVKFTHPYYDQQALDAQSELSCLQNKKDLLFCGSYFGYGFHEDGIKSSIEMLKNLNDY